MLHLPSVFLRDLFAAALCASLALTVLTSSAKADVQVTLTDGRQITADSIGEESNTESAALQIKNKRATITRWVPWTRIARATLDGKTLTGSQLRQHIIGETRDVTSNHVTQVAHQIPLDGPVLLAPPPSVPCVIAPADACLFAPAPYCDRGTVIGVRDDPLSAYADKERQYFPHGVPLNERGFALDVLRRSTAQNILGVVPLMPVAPQFPLAPTPLAPPPVNAIPPGPPSPGLTSSIAAQAVSFAAYGKADIDALLVDLAAFDANGNAVPLVPNTVFRATLWGQKQKLLHAYGNEFIGDARGIDQIGVWSVALTPPQAAARRLVLPLPAPLPEHDIARYPVADLQVELSIAGQGVYETTATNIPLKQMSPLRDRALIDGMSPFLPQQLTTGSRVLVGPAFEARSVLRPQSRVLTVQP